MGSVTGWRMFTWNWGGERIMSAAFGHIESSRRESATFEYSKSWLENPQRSALEPALTLDPGLHHTIVNYRMGEMGATLGIHDSLTHFSAVCSDSQAPNVWIRSRRLNFHAVQLSGVPSSSPRMALNGRSCLS